MADALAEAHCTLNDLDAVAATAGPGLIGGVMVGLTTAKALAMAAGKPLVAINHLEAHALTARLTDGVAFPFLLLLISGGHCQLLAVEGVGRFRLYGTTIDDAVGEAFDKTAKLMHLPYPGGPNIEALALSGNPKRFALPRPMLGREGADFSLSGLKTAVRLVATASGFGASDRADLAASFQAGDCRCSDRSHARRNGPLRIGIRNRTDTRRRRRCRCQLRDPRCAFRALFRKTFRDKKTPAEAMHRQCCDGRLGRGRKKPVGALRRTWGRA